MPPDSSLCHTAAGHACYDTLQVWLAAVSTQPVVYVLLLLLLQLSSQAAACAGGLTAGWRQAAPSSAARCPSRERHAQQPARQRPDQQPTAGLVGDGLTCMAMKRSSGALVSAIALQQHVIRARGMMTG